MDYMNWILSGTGVTAAVFIFLKILRKNFESIDYQFVKIDKRETFFEQKLNEKITCLENGIDTNSRTIEEKIREGFQRIDEKFMTVEEKMSQRFHTTEERFQEIQYAISDVKERLAFLEACSIHLMPDQPSKPNLRSEAAKLRWQKRRMKKGE